MSCTAKHGASDWQGVDYADKGITRNCCAVTVESGLDFTSGIAFEA